MSTGQTSVSLAAMTASAATPGAISTSMKRLDMLGDPRADHARDVLDPLGDLDTCRGEAGDLLGRRVLLTLHDRAGVAERHAGHLVHEAPGHEGKDREPRVVVRDPVGELLLHPPARLGVNHDR